MTSRKRQPSIVITCVDEGITKCVNFTLEQAMNAQRGVELWFYYFFNLGARSGWMVNATLLPLYPQDRPGTHCIGGWVGPRTSLDGRRIWEYFIKSYPRNK
jgi:hypothetical protein